MGWFFKKENKSELTLAIEKLENHDHLPSDGDTL